MGKRSAASYQKGVSLVEALVAAAILAFTISIGSYVVMQSHKSSASLVGGSLCKVRSEWLIQNFSNNANKTNISNWVYSTGGNPYPSGTQVQHSELGFVLGGNQSNIITPSASAPGISASQTNGWELIDASTNWALYLATKYPAFCDVSSAEVGATNFGQAVASWSGTQPTRFPPAALSFATQGAGWNGGLAPPQGAPPSVLNNETDYLNIRMINKKGVYGCPGVGGFPTTLIPNGKDIPPGTDVAIEVVGSISYSNAGDPPGAPVHYCQSSAKLKLDADTSPPVFKSPATVPNSLMPAPGYCGPAPNNLICLSNSTGPIATPNPLPIACNPSLAAGVSVGFQVNEPGTVFACALSYGTVPLPPFTANSAALQLCGTPTTAGGVPVTMTANPYAGSYVNGSGEVISISGGAAQLPEGYYRIWVRAFDSAQNVTDQSLDFEVSQFNGSIALKPPGLQIAPFNAFPVATRNHFPVGQPWNTTFSFPGQIFECSDTLPGVDYWTLTATAGPTPLIPPTGIWSYTNGQTGVTAPWSGGNCTAQVLTPAGLADGNYTMSATACSPCGVPVPGATPVSQPWIVDMKAGPTPAHSPTSVPTSNFSTFPTWTFSQAKPTPLPYEYSCQSVSSTFSAISGPSPAFCGGPTLGFAATAAPPNPDPCTMQNSLGFCTMSVDGCGNLNPDKNTPYQILAAQGQGCCNVPCQTGLTCAMDQSANRGKCVVPVAGGCSKDSDCAGGGTCYVAEGLCYGAGPGPAPQTCSSLPPPPPTPPPFTPPPFTPVPTPAAPTPIPVASYQCTCTYGSVCGFGTVAVPPVIYCQSSPTCSCTGLGACSPITTGTLCPTSCSSTSCN